jgi:hypothetical protein
MQVLMLLKIQQEGLSLDRKGQIFSIDLMISLAIFLFIIVVSLSMWNLYMEKSKIIDQRADMEFVARNAISGLLTTGGDPSSWYLLETFDVDSLGVAISDYRLLPAKISKLQVLNDTNYAEVKESLGVDLYEMHLSFVNSSGSEVYKFGTNSSSLSNQIVRIERLALVDGDVFTVVMEVWDE